MWILEQITISKFCYQSCRQMCKVFLKGVAIVQLTIENRSYIERPQRCGDFQNIFYCPFVPFKTTWSENISRSTLYTICIDMFLYTWNTCYISFMWWKVRMNKSFTCQLLLNGCWWWLGLVVVGGTRVFIICFFRLTEPHPFNEHTMPIYTIIVIVCIEKRF